MADAFSLRTRVGQRLEGLRQDRISWWAHWQELALFVLPRRYRWLANPNASTRGSPINGAILDSTGTIAARTCASGMMSGITSPTRPWFKLEVPGIATDETSPAALWLAEVEARMARVMAESNFYNSMATLFFDLVVFGTGVLIIYEDYEDVIRCYNPCAGEYFLANSDRLAVDTMYREFTLTVSQLVQWFGKANCSITVREAYKQGGAALQREIVVAHAIEPNAPAIGSISKDFPYREIYWEFGGATASSKEEPSSLTERGFHELPMLAPRWDLSGNDAYGRSPAMDALGDIKQLQQETKRKAQAIDKMVNPPLVGDIQLKNQPTVLTPGGITYVQGMNNAGLKPVYTVMPPVQEIMLDIKEVQDRIKTTFFNDLFLMISQLDTVRTATEIDARKEEKLVQLGPVYERFLVEGLGPAVNRTFNIMSRVGLLPPPPDELSGAYIKVRYVSVLASAQRAVATQGIERWLTLGGNLAPVDPSIMDNYDLDQTVQKYADLLNVDPTLVRSDDAIAAIRDERAKQQQEQQALEAAPAAADTAKTLSETQVGKPGVSALSALTGINQP